MAEIQEIQAVEVEKARKRKHNFSVNEIAVITENVEMNLAIIQSKLTNNITNKKKTTFGKTTRAVNAVGLASHTVAEIKDKWKNLHSTAKRDFSSFRREAKKTGGGPAPKPPSAASEKIIELFEETLPNCFSLLSGTTNPSNKSAILFVDVKLYSPISGLINLAGSIKFNT